MTKKLVIVEAPTKAKTIKKYLGKDYTVLASYGHVRDLLPKEGAVDPANDFAMKYELIAKNAKHVKLILEAVKNADEILLATDPDREGEAISYHILEILKAKKALKGKTVQRVVFHEITKKAIQEAVLNPRDLLMPLVYAQQARRALDYLVGFNLSPLLWRKVRPGLSAGRVQSPALRMIVERELEIEAFDSKEYWTIAAACLKGNVKFSAKLFEYEGKRVQQFDWTTADAAHAVVNAIETQPSTPLTVQSIEKKQRKRQPSAPFTTSTLQQEASRKLGFGTSRTMRIAQQLYEGIDIGDGAVGLISYMRTDSVTLADSAIEECRELIGKRFGATSLPDAPRVYKTKAKNAQEAHEAIRPTNFYIDPDEIKSALSLEQYKLYKLIWQRTVSSQMTHATLDTVAIDLVKDQALFRANGSVVTDPGFLQVYEEGLDDEKKDPEDKMLPPMKEGDVIQANPIAAEQHFTEPPPRFTEASLVKTLEEHGIGRPSTTAGIITTLVSREYVELEAKRFKPTDVGRVVNRFLTQFFTKYVDYSFTANLEDELDAVARDEKEWLPLLKEFWEPFHAQIEHTSENVKRKDVTHEAIDEACPKCSKPLSIRLGRRGRFIGCTDYPTCDYTRSLDGNPEEDTTPEIVEGRQCPLCQSDLVVKTGRYGKFIGCSSYPKCKHIESLNKPENTEVECPQCHQSTLLKRKSKRGKIFYSCGRYPDCDYAMWDEPIAQACPECEWPITGIKHTKRKGSERVCPQKDCGFSEPYES